MKLVLATHNKHKIQEMSDILKSINNDFELLSLDDIGFTGDIVEYADTFEGNSLIKAKTISDFRGLPSIADDSGLMVDILGGTPGVYSARFAGEGCSSSDNNDKLLRLLQGVEFDKRTARFVSVITLYMPNGDTISARGECEGLITFSPKGNGTFGYDPVFYYPTYGKTFAEMSPSEKNNVSHRGNALKIFAKKLLYYKFIS
ncbi:MAG: non-canonical purine NTP pyrophosphatase, RdgB/HAM1 family [Clostridiales bacterium GWF2_38_85]|nr:MAG: non-canonical purine NTP pyrophosphatase, RdgB/HAM1 family [Clostridiales bacterium GWF2_38_85]HBL83888.1 non-canonical purine NTP pyrophosphatase, RdgB/HAM1 family [Clostridiales bacterium]